MTEKQNKFVREYLIDLNGTRAAIRAGYSVKTAAEQASRLLRNVKVQEAIETAMARRSRRTGVIQDRVLNELAKLAFVQITDVIDPDSAEIKRDAAEEDLACIQSVRIKPNEWGVEREVKLYDKKSALELLGRHLGMFKDNLNVTIETSQKLDDIISQIGGEGLEE